MGNIENTTNANKSYTPPVIRSISFKKNGGKRKKNKITKKKRKY
jgi:hypothetical protein